MQRYALALLAAVIVTACAHGPRVVKVEPGSERLDHTHIFYALPMTQVAVELPLTVRTVEKGLLHDPVEGVLFDPNAKCDDGSRPAVHARLCLHGLRPATAARADALLNCPHGGGVVVGPAVLQGTTLAVPDPEHVYAVRMRAGSFEKLKASLQLAAHGAPAAFSATGESAWLEVSKFLLVAATRTLSTDSSLKAVMPVGVTERIAAVSPTVENVLGRIEQLQADRLRLARAGSLSPASRDVLDSELARLRQILEGRLIERPVTARLMFTPTGATGRVRASQALTGVCPPHKQGESSTPVALAAWLSLEPLPGHASFIGRVRESTVEPSNADDSGLRYRVASIATGQVGLTLCQSPPVVQETASAPPYCPSVMPDPTHTRWVPLQSSLTIAQGGQVRSLPRRLGFGSGHLEAAFDPLSGGLTAVTSDSKGASYDGLRTVVDEAGTDHELAALEREAKLLQQRKSICDNRRALGMPIPQDCNEAKSPGQ